MSTVDAQSALRQLSEKLGVTVVRVEVGSTTVDLWCDRVPAPAAEARFVSEVHRIDPGKTVVIHPAEETTK